MNSGAITGSFSFGLALATVLFTGAAPEVVTEALAGFAESLVSWVSFCFLTAAVLSAAGVEDAGVFFNAGFTGADFFGVVVADSLLCPFFVGITFNGLVVSSEGNSNLQTLPWVQPRATRFKKRDLSLEVKL